MTAAAKIEKLIVAPTDGSMASINALEYIGDFFGPRHRVVVNLVYVMPALPPILVEESRHNRQTAGMLKKMEQKHHETAKTALDLGRQRLLKLGIVEERIRTGIQMQTTTIANDICNFAQNASADAIVLGSRGKSRLESFFINATATKVIEAGKLCPAWIVLGKVKQQGVLIAVDRSSEALRAVDHAGFMIADSDHPVTLFYSQRSLTAFVPRQVVDAAPNMEHIWQDRIGKAIAPVMQKARQMLIDAGVEASRIKIQISEGTRSAAADIIKSARKLNCGTIILGRRGTTAQSKLLMGSVSRNVMEGCEDTAVWIVP
jgi:nucleotide-binding universal stress UspA family protein